MKCAIEHDLAAYDQRQSCAEQAEAKSEFLLDQFYKMEIDDLIWQLEQFSRAYSSSNIGGTAVSRQKVKQLVHKIEEALQEIAEIMAS